MKQGHSVLDCVPGEAEPLVATLGVYFSGGAACVAVSWVRAHADAAAVSEHGLFAAAGCASLTRLELLEAAPAQRDEV